MKQEARSYVPGLNPVAFWDTSSMAWARTLEESWEVVRDEFERVALQDAKRTKRVGNNVWAGAADSDSAQKYGQDWKTLVLMDRTTWDPVNSKLFPRTAKLLADAEAPIVEAFFAAMTPRSRINPHTPCNFILTRTGRGYRGLQPDGRRRRGRGRRMLFDTSLYHDAANDSDDTRYCTPRTGTLNSRTSSGRPSVPVRRVGRAHLISSDPVAQFRAEPSRGPAHAAEVRARAALLTAGAQAEAAGEQEEKEEEAGPGACGWLRRVHVKHRRRGAPLLPILIK